MQNTIYDMFKNIVKKHSNENAIIENERVMTFAQLSDMVDMIAESFPPKLTAVGIVMRHRAEMIASMLAVLKCGAFYVSAEPNFPTGRIHDMMTESGVDFILTEQEFTQKLIGFPIRLTDCEICGVETPLSQRKINLQENNPAYVLYTSGTTGKPKGVCVTNKNVCHYVRAFADEFNVKQGDVMLQYSVCTFDIFVEEVFCSLLNGASCAIPDTDDKNNIHSLMNFVEKHNVTIISGFPYLLAKLNHLPTIPSSLRLLISGGDVLRAIYVDNLLKHCTVYNTYGPSETTVCATYFLCNNKNALQDGTYPIGHAIKGAQVHILGDGTTEKPLGETGEICISGDGVSLGYIGKHDEENKAFVQLPGGKTMYRSGDFGFIDTNGDVIFLHRKDNQIMIYGKRVELSEVESRLYQCHGVNEAIVRAFTDEKGLFYMIAYVILDDKNVSVSDIKKELAENLTDFMIPEYFVKMQNFPLNANGKIDIVRFPVVMKE